MPGERPVYTSCQGLPLAAACLTIGRIGVIPIPPAMNR